MQIVTRHLCRYEPEDIYQLVRQDLESKGILLLDTEPQSKVENGKTILVFEGTNIDNSPVTVGVTKKEEPEKRVSREPKTRRPRRTTAQIQAEKDNGELAEKSPAQIPAQAKPVQEAFSATERQVATPIEIPLTSLPQVSIR